MKIKTQSLRVGNVLLLGACLLSILACGGGGTETGTLLLGGADLLADGPGLYGRVAIGDTIEIVRSR